MYDYDLVSEILTLGSYKAIANVLEGYTLEDEQCIDTVLMLARKSGILCYETGLGKTLIASALMKLLKREKSDRRFIFLAKKNQLLQTPDKIMNACGLSVLDVTSASGEVNKKLLSQDFSKYDVLMITHECLNNPDVMLLLLQRADMYCGIFIDEAHNLNNFVEASSAFMLRSVVHNFEYRYALTATPIVTSVMQLANLCHIVERESFPDPKDFAKQMEYGFDVRGKLKDFLIFRDRKSLGIPVNKISKAIYVKAMPHQAGVYGNGMFKTTKGEGAFVQVQALADTIVNERPGKGLVYINQHEVREFVEKELYKSGIRFASVHGKTPTKDRGPIVEAFTRGELDVVLTSVTEALDLDCDYVFFYEFTSNVKQMLGRGIRGLNPKTIKIFHLFTTHTGEINYFMNNIYNRSLIIQDILQQDYSELIALGQQLGGS